MLSHICFIDQGPRQLNNTTYTYSNRPQAAQAAQAAQATQAQAQDQRERGSSRTVLNPLLCTYVAIYVQYSTYEYIRCGISQRLLENLVFVLSECDCICIHT
jgi:hypothetical protein